MSFRVWRHHPRLERHFRLGGHFPWLRGWMPDRRCFKHFVKFVIFGIIIIRIGNYCSFHVHSHFHVKNSQQRLCLGVVSWSSFTCSLLLLWSLMRLKSLGHTNGHCPEGVDQVGGGSGKSFIELPYAVVALVLLSKWRKKTNFQRKFRENTFISERHEYIFTIASFQHWQLQTLFQHNLCWHYACRSSWRQWRRRRKRASQGRGWRQTSTRGLGDTYWPDQDFLSKLRSNGNGCYAEAFHIFALHFLVPNSRKKIISRKIWVAEKLPLHNRW